MPTLTIESIKAALTPSDFTLVAKPRIHFNTFAKVLKDAVSPAYIEAQACWNNIIKYGVDPAVALAQFQHESTYGKFGLALGNKSWGNIRYATGHFIQYVNWAAGALNYAQLISGSLYAKDLNYNTVRKMPYRYAPASDGNAPASYGAGMVASINSYIALDKKLNPEKPPVSTDRATELTNAIHTRVQYIRNLIVSRNMELASYLDDFTAINTYADELHALAGGKSVTAPAAIPSAENSAGTVVPPTQPSTPVPTDPVRTVVPSTIIIPDHIEILNYVPVRGTVIENDANGIIIVGVANMPDSPSQDSMPGSENLPGYMGPAGGWPTSGEWVPSTGILENVWEDNRIMPLAKAGPHARACYIGTTSGGLWGTFITPDNPDNIEVGPVGSLFQ